MPGTEGRAGMAAIIDHDETLNLEQLYDGMAKSLASYARPLFVRTVKQIEMTGMYVDISLILLLILLCKAVFLKNYPYTLPSLPC